MQVLAQWVGGGTLPPASLTGSQLTLMLFKLGLHFALQSSKLHHAGVHQRFFGEKDDSVPNPERMIVMFAMMIEMFV